MAGSYKNEQGKKGRTKAKLEVFAHEIGRSPNAVRHHSSKARSYLRDFLIKNLDFVVLTILLLSVVGTIFCLANQN
jgi:hypothetical protein